MLDAPTVASRGKRLGRDLIDGFRRNELLLFASAICFQVLTSLVPLLLFALGSLGFLGLTDAWTGDLRPTVAENVSAAGLEVIDGTVRKVLGSAQLFWVTAGAAIAIWQLSGAVRAAMGAMNAVYASEDGRSFPKRFALSIGLAVAVTALTFGAVAVVHFAPLLYGDVGALMGVVSVIVRWGLAALLLGLAVGLLVHVGVCREQPLGWVSAGALAIVGAWVLMSVGFGVYLTTVASYGSIYGALASVVILMGYLYASIVVFLAGVQLDAIIRDV